MSWRDDLPEIPGDRIRAAATRDGARRRAARQRRRILFVEGAAIAVAVLLVGGVIALTQRDSGTDSSSATTAGAAAATTASATQTTIGGAATTGAAATTAAAAATTAAGTATTAAGATTPATAGGTGTTIPLDPTVRAEPAVVSEEPSGRPPCGPTEFKVTVPLAADETTAVLRWLPFVGEVPMTVAGGEATVTIGPFAAGTLPTPGPPVGAPVDLIITDSSGGTRTVRGPVVTITACRG
jgi:hypothetical protein